MHTSAPGPCSPHGSHHPNPSGLQEVAGKHGLKKQRLEICGVCKGGGREPAPQRNPPLQLRALLLATATPSAQLLAPRGRVRGGLQKSWAWTMHSAVPKHSRDSAGHIPHPLLGLFPEQRMPRRIQCISIRPEFNNLLLASSSPKPNWAAATLRGLGHVPVLCLPTQGEKWAKKPHTRARKKRDNGEEGKLKSA